MSEVINVPTMAEMLAQGKQPEVLFWVGCAGSFDDRAKKVTKAIAKILHATGVKFAVLGVEESCTGDPAKRAARLGHRAQHRRSDLPAAGRPGGGDRGRPRDQCQGRRAGVEPGVPQDGNRLPAIELRGRSGRRRAGCHAASGEAFSRQRPQPE